jgi:hypothetical protein
VTSVHRSTPSDSTRCLTRLADGARDRRDHDLEHVARAFLLASKARDARAAKLRELWQAVA